MIPTSTTDTPTARDLKRGLASLPDIAGDAVLQRVATLLRRPLRDEPTSSVTRGVLAIACGTLAMIWPEISLGAMLVVFGIYAVVDATLAIVTAVMSRNYRGRLLLQAAVDIGIVAVALAHRDFTRTAALTVLAVWVVVMALLRLWDAVSIQNGKVRVNYLLAALACLAIVPGVSAIVSPDDNVRIVIINVWIFTILRGVMLIVRARRADAASR